MRSEKSYLLALQAQKQKEAEVLEMAGKVTRKEIELKEQEIIVFEAQRVLLAEEIQRISKESAKLDNGGGNNDEAAE